MLPCWKSRLLFSVSSGTAYERPRDAEMTAWKGLTGEEPKDNETEEYEGNRSLAHKRMIGRGTQINSAGGRRAMESPVSAATSALAIGARAFGLQHLVVEHQVSAAHASAPIHRFSRAALHELHQRRDDLRARHIRIQGPPGLETQWLQWLPGSLWAILIRHICFRFCRFVGTPLTSIRSGKGRRATANGAGTNGRGSRS